MTTSTLPARAYAAVIFFIAVTFLVLALPDYPGGLTASSFVRLPLELPLALLILMLCGKKAARPVAGILALLLLLVFMLKVMDLIAQTAVHRPFNPYLDAGLAKNGWIFLSGTIGIIPAGLAIVLCLFLIACAFYGLFRAGLVISQQTGKLRRSIAAISLLLTALCAGSWMTGIPANNVGLTKPESAFYVARRVALITSSIKDLRKFEKILATETLPQQPKGMFQDLKGRDVVLMFVESYGRSAIEDPQYAPLIQKRLQNVQEQLTQSGYSQVSGWLKSPTVGGISWLAHGTFLSGLWVDNQARYDLLMRSDHPSLNRLFHDAGWRTVAVMPAITMDWPEASYFGYDKTYVSDSLGYEGKPFNWVTMPDQYTLSAFDRFEREGRSDTAKPVMAEIALISSHAPWTPIPHLIDWGNVGNGSVFNSQAIKGDPPAVVWADPARVRVQYIRSIDYALQTIGDYIAHYGRNAVFIILGDHQPAPIITGLDASRAVPVHIISNDEGLTDRFLENGFSRGMQPDANLEEQPMSVMRNRLISLYSKPD